MVESSISLNCQKVIKLSFVELKDLHIEVPEFQRIVSLANVNAIVDFQLDHKRNKGYFLYLGTISLILYNDKYYLCDGQHRYESIKQLYNKYGHNVEAYYEIIHAENKEHVHSIFKLINQNTPMPDIEFEAPSHKVILQELCHYFQEKYTKIWSKGKDENRCAQRPFLSYHHFQKALLFLIETLSDTYNSSALIQMIEQKNQLICHRNIELIPNTTPIMKKKAGKWNFYLGLYSFDTKVIYGYTWTKEIYENVKGAQPSSFYKSTFSNNEESDESGKKVKKYKKKKIPKSLRSKCWNEYIGESNAMSYCICCGNNIIKMLEFECGHIIAERNGGSLDLQNLLPICGTCNRSMGTQNMEDYVEQYHKEQLEDFIDRNYNVIHNE
jgi:hypothetical protein